MATVVDDLQDEDLTRATRRWVERVVIEHNLCPFAKRELLAERVRFVVSRASTEADLLESLALELEKLCEEPSIETTLLIHPDVLGDFFDYNQFLDLADSLLLHMDLEGVFQIASFHPDYQFAGTEPDDAENFTNRSPYPLLHLLREESLEKAIAHTVDIEQVPLRNIETMKRLGFESLQRVLRGCVESMD